MLNPVYSGYGSNGNSGAVCSTEEEAEIAKEVFEGDGYKASTAYSKW